MTERREWLAMLARMTTPHDPVRALEAMLAYLPLMDDLPDGAFTKDSLRHVATQPRRLHIPDLSEVVTPLTAWWRDNRPARTALATPRRAEPATERQPPTEAEKAAVAAALAPFRSKRPAAEVVPIRANTLPPDVLARMRAQRGNG
jgi:hypothetical protein